jgi:hypothetical protein
MVLLCGAVSVGLTLSCSGSIMPSGGNGNGGNGNGNNGNPPGNGGPPGNGTPGGNNGSSPPILPPVMPGAMACEPSNQFTPARIWRLSDTQYSQAVKDLIPGVPVPNISTPGRSEQQFVEFSELFDIGPATTAEIRASATAVGTEAVKNLPALLACKGGEDANTCSGRFVEELGSRAFRRPLDDVEKQGLRAVYAEGAKLNQAEGVKMAITAILQSASFLYRTELGKAGTVAPGQTVELTAHELASALSFLLLNSIPDPELRGAADNGSLLKNDVFKAQVERLLKLPRVQDQLTTAYLKWMGLGIGINADLATQEKEFTAELKGSLEQESALFFKELLGKGGTMDDLLRSNKGFVDRVLATHFGMPAPAGAGFQPVTYPAEQRSGALTLGGVVARYSLGHAEVFRGKFVRDEFLCQEIPPPPNIPEIEEETKNSESLPARTQVQRRLDNQICGSCHRMMDPIGLAYSGYDALGRFKGGDASGELTGAGDVDGPLNGVVDLGQKLAKSSVARICVESKMLSYALGRMPEKYDECELQKIDAFVKAGGGKLSDLMAAVVYSSAFRFRTGGN